MAILIIFSSIGCIAIWVWVFGDIFDWWRRLEFWMLTRRFR
jgi:hypothetical protein